MSCSSRSTVWRRWSSGGCWARIKVRSTRRTSRATSKSSSSGSTDAARAAEAGLLRVLGIAVARAGALPRARWLVLNGVYGAGVIVPAAVSGLYRCS